jgi:hypothetical protein
MATPPASTPPHKRPASVPAGMGRDSPCIAWCWCPYNNAQTLVTTAQEVQQQQQAGVAFSATEEQELTLLRPECSFGAAGSVVISRRSTSSVSPISNTKRAASMSTPIRTTPSSAATHYHHHNHHRHAGGSQTTPMVGLAAPTTMSLMSLSEDRFVAAPHLPTHFHHQNQIFSMPASASSAPLSGVAAARTPFIEEELSSVCATPAGGRESASCPPALLARPSSRIRFDPELEYPCDVLDDDMVMQSSDRVEKRLRQIDFHGKGTVGYSNYLLAVPKALRQVGNDNHPVTPRVACNNSKRRFDMLVSAWRVALHKWDETDGSPRMIENTDGAHPTWAKAGIIITRPAPDAAGVQATTSKAAAADDDDDDDADGPPGVERTLQGEIGACGEEPTAGTPQTEGRKALSMRSPAVAMTTAKHAARSDAGQDLSPQATAAKVTAFKQLLEETMREHRRQSESPRASSV